VYSSDGFAFDHHVGGDRKHVRPGARPDKTLQPFGDSAAQDPDRPVVNVTVRTAIDHDPDIPPRHRPVEDQATNRHHRVGDAGSYHLKSVAAEIVEVRARRRCAREWNRTMQLLERAGGSGHVLSVRRYCTILC